MLGTGSEGHACAVLVDGTLQCWGRNDKGQVRARAAGRGEGDGLRGRAEPGGPSRADGTRTKAEAGRRM